MNKLENFLNQYEATATRNSYSISLNQFFKWIKSDPDNYLKKNPEAIKEDIKNYWIHIKKTYKPKYTRNVKLNAVRQYLIEYEIEFPTVFWKRLKKAKDKGARAATQDRAPTRHELRRIIHEGKPIARAIFLMAASTGMRIGEILALNKNDIDLSKNPAWVNIRSETTKTGDARTVYLSDESRIALDRWLNDRKRWIANAKSKMEKLSKYKGFEKVTSRHEKDNGTIFPVTRQTLESYWQIMLKRANLDMRDPTTNVRVLHAHVLRKFFRTNMAKPLGLDVVEALLGHRGYLTEAYRRYSKEDMAKIYQKNMDHVTVIQEPKNLEKLENDMGEKLQEKDEEIRKLKNQMAEIQTTVSKLQSMAVLELKSQLFDWMGKPIKRKK